MGAVHRSVYLLPIQYGAHRIEKEQNMKGWIYLGALIVGIASTVFALTVPSHIVEGACGLGASVLVFLGTTLIS
jgi:hypothetical protein